jgi:translation initiation factor 1
VSKRDRKQDKIAVPAAGSGSGLRHNAFAALAGVNAPPSAAEPARAENAAPTPAVAKTRGRLLLRREKKGRGGKTVVIVAGLRAQAHLAESEIADLAPHLKQQLGCGGAIERVAGDSELVLQGDQPARVAELLQARGFRVAGVTR